MIYIIGGAPRIGKSIIAKQLSNHISTDLFSTDKIIIPENITQVMFYGDPKKNILTPGQRLDYLRKEAESIFPKIKEIIDKSIKSKENIVVEGVHLLPDFVNNIILQYEQDNIKSIFIGSYDSKLIMEGMKNNNSENNWLKDSDNDVLLQVAAFTEFFSNYVSVECRKFNLLYRERSNNFERDILDVMNILR